MDCELPKVLRQGGHGGQDAPQKLSLPYIIPAKRSYVLEPPNNYVFPCKKNLAETGMYVGGSVPPKWNDIIGIVGEANEQADKMIDKLHEQFHGHGICLLDKSSYLDGTELLGIIEAELSSVKSKTSRENIMSKLAGLLIYNCIGHWSKLTNGACRDSAINTRFTQMTALVKIFLRRGISLGNPAVFARPDLTDLMLKYAKEDGYKESTVRSLATVLATILYDANGNMDAYKEAVTKSRNKSQPDDAPEDEGINLADQKPLFLKKMASPFENRAIRIMSALIYYGLGGIRIDDLIRTRIVSLDRIKDPLVDELYERDNDHILDLDQRTWHFNALGTKNGKERKINVPEEFCEYVRKNVPPHILILVVKSDGKRFQHTSSVCALFKRTFGYPYGQVRKSVCNEVTSVNQAKELANVLGHDIVTQAINYRSGGRSAPQAPLDDDSVKGEEEGEEGEESVPPPSPADSTIDLSEDF